MSTFGGMQDQRFLTAQSRDLQTLAETFSNSPDREVVRRRAEEVDIESLDSEKFMALLSGLFQNGIITRQRIVVLFFFCSDVAILAINQQASKLVSNLTEWSLTFIRNHVNAWVQEQGGWSAVLSSGLSNLQRALIIGACVAIVASSIVYIRKNIT